jgi:hypothetical protein
MMQTHGPDTRTPPIQQSDGKLALMPLNLNAKKQSSNTRSTDKFIEVERILNSSPLLFFICPVTMAHMATSSVEVTPIELRFHTA